MSDMRLVHQDTGAPINIGDTVTTFRNETFTLVGWVPPYKPGAAGMVYIERPCTHTKADHERIYWCRGVDHGDYYPGVINAKIVPVES